ncbi:hypothetical protein GWI33_010175 [Rhynchophorus ferrugineus]|uniref:Uncharacterized protein n=1 Tax=Rhynchophorus ferrugineus TaxID=354439 RepID=A0A834ISS6_RHYFE|nr:hypothetical protein GWI33_010175 [Rhynchophorus ferrugineus]
MPQKTRSQEGLAARRGEHEGRAPEDLRGEGGEGAGGRTLISGSATIVFACVFPNAFPPYFFVDRPFYRAVLIGNPPRRLPSCGRAEQYQSLSRDSNAVLYIMDNGLFPGRERG